MFVIFGRVKGMGEFAEFNTLSKRLVKEGKGSLYIHKERAEKICAVFSELNKDIYFEVREIADLDKDY